MRDPRKDWRSLGESNPSFQNENLTYGATCLLDAPHFLPLSTTLIASPHISSPRKSVTLLAYRLHRERYAGVYFEDK